MLPSFDDWLTVDKKVCPTFSDVKESMVNVSGNVFKSVPHSVLTFLTPNCSFLGEIVLLQ